MQTEFGSTIGSFSAEGRKTFIASREIAGLTVDRICGNADERGEKFMWLEITERATFRCNDGSSENP